MQTFFSINQLIIMKNTHHKFLVKSSNCLFYPKPEDIQFAITHNREKKKQIFTIMKLETIADLNSYQSSFRFIFNINKK